MNNAFFKAVALVVAIALYGLLVVFTVAATRDDNTYYRVVATTKTSTLEKEINVAAQEGCSPKFFAAQGDLGELVMVLECSK